MATSSYRWVIVAAGGLLGCVAVGGMFSLPVLLAPMVEATGWSHTGISTAMTIGFLAMAVGSIVWGMVTDRVGPRRVVLTGSCLLAASLALASYSRSLLEFQLAFGLLVGLATSAIFAPMMATVTGWFFLAVWASNHTTVRWVRPMFDLSKCQMFGGTTGVAWGRSQYGWRVAGVDYSSAWDSTLPTLEAASDIVHQNPILPYWEYT